MRRFLTRYAAFFRLPDVVRLLAIVLVARMPVGMMSLALLMHLRQLSGSFAFAGATVGTYLVAMACSAASASKVRLVTSPAYGSGRWVIREPGG